MGGLARVREGEMRRWSVRNTEPNTENTVSSIISSENLGWKSCSPINTACEHGLRTRIVRSVCMCVVSVVTWLKRLLTLMDLPKSAFRFSCTSAAQRSKNPSQSDEATNG